HPLEREGAVVLTVARAPGLLLADPGRLLARRLVGDEQAVLDEVPALGPHAVVVVAAGREAPGRRLVGVDRDDRRGVLQLPELVRRREGGPREVRLVAERAVQLRRVPDGLVDREPEVRRCED